MASRPERGERSSSSAVRVTLQNEPSGGMAQSTMNSVAPDTDHDRCASA